MGIGRIASFLSSLSPASESAAAVSSADRELPESLRQTEASMAQQDHERQRQGAGPADIVQQLQTMIAAVRTLADNAVQQGAALPVSQTGAQLRNAVSGLGHLLSALDPQTLNMVQTQVREAGKAVDAVEAGLTGTKESAEQVFRTMSADQAQAAKAISERFQTEMQDAVSRVRGAVSMVVLPQ
ncbi:Secreted protein [Magnetospirillum sp. LM-5]|nr:Secreted protein [Magnetospirillum sp. LM-5]